ncbi:hypothetical protein B0H19DRAFT_1201851 [Mycena capillaripes]|nr:hypothetical protein B0H19DRAFT_1201851 [Mycena capillaripes]
MLVSRFYEYPLLGLVLLVLVEGRLLLRQSTFDPSQIPEECQTTCNSVIDTANTCTTFQCLCTPANDKAVLSCVDCVTASNHTSTAIIDGQDILNQFASQCNLNNVSVSSLSASGVATVTGITTSNLDPQTSSAASQSQTSPSASATSPSLSTASTSAPPSASPNPASAIILDLSLYSSLWPSYIALIVVALAMF